MINHHLSMFGNRKHEDNEEEEHRQRVDNALNDKVIEREIKACQQENGECMKSTSRNLRERYGNEKVSTILRRLRQRKHRQNKKSSQGLGHITEYLNQFQDKL
jgi:hypothetical protein